MQNYDSSSNNKWKFVSQGKWFTAETMLKIKNERDYLIEEHYISKE
jgi:hypothetical protein